MSNRSGVSRGDRNRNARLREAVPRTNAIVGIIAAAILRQLHAVVVHRQAWDPALATGATKTEGPLVAA